MGLAWIVAKKQKNAAATKAKAASKAGLPLPVQSTKTSGFISGSSPFTSALPLVPDVAALEPAAPSPGEMKAAIVEAKSPPLSITGQLPVGMSAAIEPAPYDVPLPPGWDTGEEPASTLFGMPPLVVLGGAGLLLFLLVRR